ncbi:nucleoside 2-deoxyribosyltransferase [Thermoleptolyngbya sp. M55_K2018_002]|uniref:nucleoside 2-deoxyribosyltransferase n=1 Tax=Thermoleptolyngbya sp. M55_K2018_002 TaxID=2747808 RepID=UPI0019E05131|nr:nucleoside 2-deoxyribosyltransferase [Thermoleptolyngbya sp. M55_K2018_002]HIK41999.1 nucleoside 2-deoxyribosyltransferase [Thermoleptolyngbya sp. M55_K2018_002]
MNIYLAGPDVFLPEPLEAARAKKEICAKYGFVGQFPFDNALDLSGLTPVEAGLAIYKSNIQLMDRCDLIVANMTPFRGPSMDVGTAFEMGYMAAQGKPVFGYSNDGRLYGDRVFQPTPERDENNLFVEQFGMHDNLMLEGAIYTSSGDFQGKQIDTGSYYTDLSVFEAVIQLAAAKLLS